MMAQLPSHYNDVGYGWRTILERLHADLHRIDNKYSVEYVKELFAGLRVKLKRETPEILDVITHAEWRSEKICETCGEFGRPRLVNQQWKARCEDCYQLQGVSR